MKFESIYSSSRANLYVVTASNGSRLLIECGCTWTKLRKALNNDLSNIAGCLLSHEHEDHSRAIEDVMENGIDVFASAGTFEALSIEHRRAYVVQGKERFFVGANGYTDIKWKTSIFEIFPFIRWKTSIFEIFPFDVNHHHELSPCVEPLGFKIIDLTCGEEILFATDTRSIVPRFAAEFSIIAICCNYDGDLLREREASGDINTELAKRLPYCHMEYHETKRYLSNYCNLDKCTEIHLLHLSKDNIDAESTRAEFERELFIKTVICS